jgi:hypothetical protein
MECLTGNPKRVSQSLYFSGWLMHSLITLCTHAFCTCFCGYINELLHKPFQKRKAHVLNQEAISNQYLVSKHIKIWCAKQGIQGELHKVYIFIDAWCILWLHYAPMHSEPGSANILMNFCISLFKNLRHMYSNKKPSQVNFLWLNICKYGMPSRESKEGFTKFIFL